MPPRPYAPPLSAARSAGQEREEIPVFGTIVVGVDGSGHADHAVRVAAKIAAETNDKVVVFH
jgi:Universal stress protein family